MSLSYDNSPPPVDLRQYDDHEVENMRQGTAGLAAAALAEVVRLRALVKKLQQRRPSS